MWIIDHIDIKKIGTKLFDENADWNLKSKVS